MPITTDAAPLAARAQRLGMTQTHLAMLCGLSSATFNRAVNHLADLDIHDWRKVESVVLAIEELSRRAGGRLEWKDLSISKKMIADYEDELLNPPAPPDSDDWQLLTLALTTEDPITLALKLNIPVKDLLARLDEATRRFDHTINILSRASADTHALTEITRLETEELRKNRL